MACWQVSGQVPPATLGQIDSRTFPVLPQGENVSKDEADQIKKVLEENGATVEVK